MELVNVLILIDLFLMFGFLFLLSYIIRFKYWVYEANELFKEIINEIKKQKNS